VLDDQKVPVDWSEDDREWINGHGVPGRRRDHLAGLRADAELCRLLDLRLPDRLPAAER